MTSSSANTTTTHAPNKRRSNGRRISYAQRLARHLYEHPGVLFTSNDLGAVIGVSARTTAQYMRMRVVPYYPDIEVVHYDDYTQPCVKGWYCTGSIPSDILGTYPIVSAIPKTHTCDIIAARKAQYRNILRYMRNNPNVELTARDISEGINTPRYDNTVASPIVVGTYLHFNAPADPHIVLIQPYAKNHQRSIWMYRTAEADDEEVGL